MRERVIGIPGVILLLSGCKVIEGTQHSVHMGVDAATQFNHRGMPQNDRGVLQPEMGMGFPTRDGGTLDLDAWGNIDLTDDTGDAWFPDDNQGRFSEIDFRATYDKRVDAFDLAAGIVNYNLLNGLEFVNTPAASPRGSTTALFVSATRDVLGYSPFLEVFYDIDEVEDFYVRLGASKSFELAELWHADVTLSQGWSGEDEALWSYGVKESGLSDLSVLGSLTYDYDENTTAHVTVGASTIVDDTISEWFDAIGIESDNVWLSAGVSWSY